MVETFASRKTGAVHKQLHIECQDHYRIYQKKGLTIVSVSDGHSSCARASMGSRISCLAFEKAVLSGCGTKDLPVAVKQNYDRMVEKHLAVRPIDLPVYEQREAYGATLLGAVIAENQVILFQLGDGQITAIRSNGTLFPDLPEDKDCYLNFTSSMCYSPKMAVAHTRVACFQERCATVILSTDGYYFNGSHPWRLMAHLGNNTAVDEQFEDVLFAGENGDDQTVVLACDDVVLCDEFQTGLENTLQIGKLEKKIRRLKAEKYEMSNLLSELHKLIAAAKGSGNVQNVKAMQEMLISHRKHYEELKEELKNLKDEYKRRTKTKS